ncbi:ac124 [Choristoneura murinana nucleopolyhedrovirus]|uniref:Ac124 n=1 Tax=Choristoneura murinana nucleopolyhedrovirus TaxID=1987479 RepID=V9XSJ8_9ABAC|nr:ac124 [Choristoneura murinana nucleopolyhedrovirus]AHD25524.1 ac124 [Choristoneura murinana nucleopolyhedrovirus]BBU37515.1 hypothetical protein [Choristoneura diversana nucleopolyhedrovirus]
MNLFKRCSEYTRLTNETQTRFPFAAMSYVNVTLCAYGAVAAGYLSTVTTFAELQFLQYWFMLSLFITGLINMTLFLLKNKIESHEIVYELKMLHAMYFGNALMHYGVLNTEHSAVSAMLIANLVHCWALALLLVELTILLGHTLGTYSNYRYAKACFMIVLFISAAVTVITMGANGMKAAPLCDNLIMVALLTIAYLLTAIVWAARKEAAGSYLQRVQVVPFNDPPPPFATVEMDNFLKEKL